MASKGEPVAAKRKLLQARLQDVKKARNAQDLLVNRDWVQVHILAGIARHAKLSTTLVFKGGTALQKLFFGDSYRFSEDLDFSGLPEAPHGGDLLKALTEVCEDVSKTVTELLDERVVLALKPYQDPLARQEAFTIDFTMPWMSKPNGGVKLEITFDEPVVIAPQRRPLIVNYDGVNADILSYSLEEIIIEKMRGAPQTVEATKKREAAGKGSWMKARSRDYYDLWQIVKSEKLVVDWAQVRAKLDEKCAVRGVSIKQIDDVFIPAVLENVRKQWEGQLGGFVPGELPDVESVLDELKPLLRTKLGWDAPPPEGASDEKGEESSS